MVANYHTLIVHFPVALLGIYTFLELFKNKLSGDSWDLVRKVFIYLGLIGAGFAIFSGGMIESIYGAKFGKLFETHEMFGTLTFWFYGLFFLKYFILDILTYFKNYKIVKQNKKYLEKYVKIINKNIIAHPLLTLAFIFLTITGALGGAMVSGPNVDPIVTFVYNLLIK